MTFDSDRLLNCKTHYNPFPILEINDFLNKEEAIYKNESIIFGNRYFEFKKIVMEAYLNRVSLSSSGFYSTPKIKFNKIGRASCRERV